MKKILLIMLLICILTLTGCEFIVSEFAPQFKELEEQLRTNIPTTTNKDIRLSTGTNYATIEWHSSNEQILTSKGKVTDYNMEPVEVTLTYTIKILDEQRRGKIIVTVLPSEYTFQVDEKEVYIFVNESIYLSGKIFKNGEFEKDTGFVLIEGEYDKNKPGKYNLTASVNKTVKKLDKSGNLVSKQFKLTDTFTLIVLELQEKTFEELNTPILTDVYYSFGVNNYYIMCCNDTLNIVDLNNFTQCKEIKISGRCNSYYYKDGYLYISSVDPYDIESYEYNYTGYISKIDLDKGIKVEEISVNSAPDSIVVDKRNNIIISKEQNQHITIDYLDMNTKQISAMCSGYYGDKLIYNEQEDMVLIISTLSSGSPEAYKYNENVKAFELVEKQIKLETSTSYSKDIYIRYYNALIFNGKSSWLTYGEFVNGEVIIKEIPCANSRLLPGARSYASIDAESYVAMRCEGKKCEITWCDKETGDYQAYSLKNFDNHEIDSIHTYNKKIYMFEKTSGKVYKIN